MNHERPVGRQIRDGLSVVEIKSDDNATAELELLHELGHRYLRRTTDE